MSGFARAGDFMKKADIEKVKARKENPYLISLIENLRKDKKPIWQKVAYELSKPRRKKVEVNVSKLEQYCADGSQIVVPGKVLGAGRITRKLIVGAFAFSESARKAIESAGGKAISIEALYKNNQNGKDITIIV
jgi:large subunit ribosomal protein L18e